MGVVNLDTKHWKPAILPEFLMLTTTELQNGGLATRIAKTWASAGDFTVKALTETMPDADIVKYWGLAALNLKLTRTSKYVRLIWKNDGSVLFWADLTKMKAGEIDAVYHEIMMIAKGVPEVSIWDGWKAEPVLSQTDLMMIEKHGLPLTKQPPAQVQETAITKIKKMVAGDPDAPPVKKEPKTMTGPVVALADAKTVGQPVHGTSKGSVYYAAFIGGTVNMAIRLKPEQVSFRFEGPLVTSHGFGSNMQSFGVAMGKGYASGHFAYGSAMELSALYGALLQLCREATGVYDPKTAAPSISLLKMGVAA